MKNVFDRSIYIDEELQIKKDLLKLFSPKDNLIILDIGACEGEDSIRYSRLFPNSKVLSFEPLPKNQRKIQENIKLYKTNSIKLYPYALSDQTGTSQFYVSSGRPEHTDEKLDWDFGNKSSSLLTPDKHLETAPWIKFDEVITVQTKTLLDIAMENHITCVDFVHMDVQGAELRVLQGAGSLLKNIKSIWLEVSDIHLYKDQPVKKDVEAFMERNGFSLAKENYDGNAGDQLYLNKKYFNDINLSGSSKTNFLCFFLKKLFQ